MQKLLNIIAFYIIIGETMWKINTIGDYQDYLKQHGVDEEQIIAINFEDLDYEELTEYKKLQRLYVVAEINTVVSGLSAQ